MKEERLDRESGERLVRMARRFLSMGGNLESDEQTGPIDQERLAAALEAHLLEEIHSESEGPTRGLTAKVAAAEVLANVERGLKRIADGGDTSDLSKAEFASLEAIVRITGRPSMRYKVGRVESPNSVGENEHWAVLVAVARGKINEASASVGRVEVSGSGGSVLLGTGWRLGENLIVTNRHVASFLASNSNESIGQWKLDRAKAPLVDFGDLPGNNSARKFAITEIGYCAAEPDVDLAILKLDCSQIGVPPALEVDLLPESLGQDLESTSGSGRRFKGCEIYAVGHPYGPSKSDAISSVFGRADGSKRWSPGFVTSIETGSPVFQHDCSTLGGNSGSCVLTTGTHAVVGLHFGGRGVDALSGIGRTNVALAFSLLANNKVAAMLKSGKV